MQPTRLVSAFLVAVIAGCTGQVLEPGDETPGRARARDGEAAAPGERSGGAAAGSPSSPAAGGCSAGTLPPPRIWRLTHEQYARTLQGLFGLSAAPDVSSLLDDSVGHGIENHADLLAISPPLAQDYWDFTEQLVRSMNLTSLLPCGAADEACVSSFIASFGRRAWRRPLATEETQSLNALYRSFKQSLGAVTAVQIVMERMLLSPFFLYRTELGLPDPRSASRRTLTPHEVASELAYLITDRPPDDTLAGLADSGGLLQPGQLVKEVQRLSGTPTARDMLWGTIESWLSVDLVPSQEKVHPLYSASLMSALALETKTFVNDTLSKGDGSLRSMLTSQQSFVNALTAKVYGMTVAGNTMQKLPLNPTQRLGLLTQPAVLAAHSHPDGPGSVERGRFLAQEVLCMPIPERPDDPASQQQIEDFNRNVRATPNLTEHQMWNMLPAACAVCHRLFGNLGLALENYDQIGKYRTGDSASRPIDARGTVILEGRPVEVANAVDLFGRIAAGTEIYGCFARNYFERGFGRTVTDGDGCALDAFNRAFATSGYDVRALVPALVASDGFLFRRSFAQGERL